ncbi:Putative adenylate kinase [uncultured archaeon]|nr:Putative adenylate kinase [uncultured archaeon]
MRLIITGTPGTGKTTLAKKLGEALGFKAVNEREFALAEGIGEFDPENNELVVPLEKLGTRLNKFLARNDNVIIEGHMLCEIRAKADSVVLLRVEPERLAARLELRGYSDEKVQDNVFCEGIDYCRKHCLRNYPKAKIIEIANNKSIKETLCETIVELRSKMKLKIKSGAGKKNAKRGLRRKMQKKAGKSKK